MYHGMLVNPGGLILLLDKRKITDNGSEQGCRMNFFSRHVLFSYLATLEVRLLLDCFTFFSFFNGSVSGGSYSSIYITILQSKLIIFLHIGHNS